MTSLSPHPIWLAVLDYQRDENVGPWVIALGLGAILFNPIIPVHLDRDIWFILDLAMAGVLAAHLMLLIGLYFAFCDGLAALNILGGILQSKRT